MPPEVSLWWNQDSSSQKIVITELGGYIMNCPEAYITELTIATNTGTTTIACCPSYVLSSFLLLVSRKTKPV
jgi:hypothetical protein